METKFNFNSQVCTDKVQSERLIALGLKKETADCFLILVGDLGGPDLYTIRFGAPYEGWVEGVIPAWSLHRLIEMMPKNIAIDGDTAYPLQSQKRSDGKWCVGYQGWYDCVGDLYDNVIWIYQLLISEGYLDEFCNKG